MEIKNLAGLSEPLNKLIDVFQNGCSWIMEPAQIKRIANAKSKASEIERSDLFKNQLTELLAMNCNKSLQSARDKNQFQNIKNIYANAAQELQMIQNITDTPVNKDWSARFFDYSKDVSDEEVQAIWSRILVGEIVKPGSYFKRTLSVLREIESFEAKWFLELCKFVIYDTIIPLNKTTNNIPFNRFQSLIDCGLLNSEKCGININKDANAISGKTLSIKLDGYEKSDRIILLKGYSLTDAGAQLYHITQAETDQKLMINLKEMIEHEYDIKAEIIQN